MERCPAYDSIDAMKTEASDTDDYEIPNIITNNDAVQIQTCPAYHAIIH